VMTTTRPEIIVQGSNDRETWLDYEFKYKPGDLQRGPRWVAPHQPRLDWQMWFAALSGPRGAPQNVGGPLFDYSFTDFSTRRATGDWWKRSPHGMYFPEISLQDVRLKD